MFIKSKKGYYFWEEFLRLGVVHGFSTRIFGDMNIKNPSSTKHFNSLLKEMKIDSKYVVTMAQIHGDNVCFVGYSDRKKIIQNTDGLISAVNNIFLSATFADCVPVLFFDKVLKKFGIVHAGWKGVYKEIAKTLISKMIEKGSVPSNILVGIGPSIRVCCYNVDEKRAGDFITKFPKTKTIITKKNGKSFLNLQKVLRLQLGECKVPQKNILDCMICTKDNISEFYSFRKEHGKNSFGLSAAVIGRI